MNRNFCAGMLAFKQGVEGFEEDGFEAGSHVGKFRFGFERAVQRDGFGVNVVGAVHEGRGAGNGKGEIGERGDCVAQFDVAGKIGDDALEVVGIGIGVGGGFGVCVGIGGRACGGIRRRRLRISRSLAASTIAERVDASLGGGFHEPPVRNTEIAGEAHSLQEGARLRRNYNVSAEVGSAIQGRFGSAHEKAKNVLNATVANREIDGGGFAVFAGMAGDYAFGENIGLQKRGAYAVKCDITVGAVDESLEFAGEVNGMVSVGDEEIGNVDGAARLDVLESALKTVFSGKDAADTSEDAEIGIAESVFTGDGSLAGVTGIPRAETAVRVDIARRKRDVDGDDVGHGTVATEVGNF